ncbi:MAG: outer membrane beta-barrel protein, partial [Polyangiaceae bacterium]|nr:outer membrane beta-barrel protein [Polyangiaceae bacterium]
MKKLVLVSILTALLAPGAAFAQSEEGVSPEPEEATVAPQSEEPAPYVAEAAPVEEEVVAEAEANWYDGLSFGVFADSYYLVDWNMPSDPSAGWGNLSHRAYDLQNGFGLALAGADLKYEGDKVGATISLRFGNGASRLIGNDHPVMAPVWQAYGTWTPIDSLSLDVGQFGTIYGAEVAESWANLNYSRGALYYLMQPFYHTGLRATYTASDELSLKLLVVNGTNNIGGPLGFGEDGNHTPHLGGQVGYTPSGALSLYVGYYTGAASSGFGGGIDTDGDGEADNFTADDDWEHFVDVVAVVSAGKLTLIGNLDFYALPSADSIYWGISGALGYALTD